jgi:LmbE family N-acetylglucosaminyl deacetylase
VNALLDSLFSAGARPLQLRTLAWPRPLQVLVLAPHPDDFDAIALTLHHLHLQGHVLHVAVLTTGANGVEDGFEGVHDAAGKAVLREREQAASCAFFGLPRERLQFLRLWGEGAESDDAPLGEWIAARPADLLFLPHGNDSNRTHRRTFETVRRIAREQRLQAWACLNQDAKTVDMRVDLVHAFGEEEARWKAELLRLHRSQQERNLRTRGSGFDARVLEVNRKAAEAMGCVEPCAEVFELLRFGG